MNIIFKPFFWVGRKLYRLFSILAAFIGIIALMIGVASLVIMHYEYEGNALATANIDFIMFIITVILMIMLTGFLFFIFSLKGHVDYGKMEKNAEHADALRQIEKQQLQLAKEKAIFAREVEVTKEFRTSGPVAYLNLFFFKNSTKRLDNLIEGWRAADDIMDRYLGYKPISQISQTQESPVLEHEEQVPSIEYIKPTEPLKPMGIMIHIQRDRERDEKEQK